MNKLCDSIDTLSMAYLDDELAEEELRDFELHVHDCADCKARVDGDRARTAELRRRLAPPPAPDLLRARLSRALDAEDAAASREMRRQRVNRFILPGAASVAAVAALAVFVANRPAGSAGALTQEAIRQNTRTAPLEVQGASTEAWVRHYYRSDVTPPRFNDASVHLAGARLASIEGRDAAQFFYQLLTPDGTFELRALTFDARGVDLDGLEAVDVDGAVLHVDHRDGQNLVVFVGGDGYAYLFTSRELSLQQLAGLVVHSDLVSRVHAGRVAQ
jgi:anti-sigma factor RsiW